MVFRRRYQVVMVGDSARTAAQRSVLSEHRTEEEARTAAAAERRRLEVVRPDDARAWRLQVLRDGEVVHEERPHPEEVPPALGRPPGRGAESPEAAADAAADAAPGDAGPSSAPADPGADAPAAEGEPPPEGPVPDWVIRRFEEAVERERRRGREGPDPEGG